MDRIERIIENQSYILIINEITANFYIEIKLLGGDKLIRESILYSKK